MLYTIIGPEETPEQLSGRLQRPLCMILRANRLFSGAWLLPGREIIVPGADFCRRDAGICPAEALRIPAQLFEKHEGEIPVPERLRKWSAVHDHAILPQWRSGGKIAGLRPMESMAQFARRVGSSEAEVRHVNIYYGKAVPGVRLLIR